MMETYLWCQIVLRWSCLNATLNQPKESKAANDFLIKFRFHAN